jgi:UDPglucose 6-dehydrogenase
MRIAVCGLGKVGKPILDTLRLKGFTAVGHDSDPQKSEAPVHECVERSDAAIFIVPTPSLPDGSFSNSYLVTALIAFRAQAFAQGKTDYLYIITSTTVPGSCDSFRAFLGDNVCYKPEFIRLASVREDLLNPAFILIGEANARVGNRVQSIFQKIAHVPVKRMSLVEAELAKITLNCALTMKISLANQLHLVASRLGADSRKIMEAVGADPRINPAYLTPGWPYGGPCLPRDNRMFRYVAEKAGIDACLSEAADRINEQMGEAHERRTETHLRENQIAAT